ncbi:MAG: response regulator, partial [Nevskiales bacterium]
MSDQHILIVEDEAPIRDMLRFTLERSEFRVSEAGDVQAARLSMADQRPDLVLLDWMLPGVSGIEFARELKKDDNTRDLPIIMVTARSEEEEKVKGLNLGCDDYIVKPFSSSELVARVRAVLRRTQPGGEEQRIEVDGLVVDGSSQRVSARGETLRLGPTEYRLLHFFIS